MGLNLLMYGDYRSFEDILKLDLFILKYKNVFEVGSVKPLQLRRRPDITTKLTSTFFLSYKSINFCVYPFVLKVWNTSGKWDSILVAIDINLYDLSYLT